MLLRKPPPPGRLVDIGGFRLHLHATGRGPVVVFDAALGGSSISWTFVAHDVRTFARACTYDRAGFGWSDAGPLPRTVGRIAAELHQLLRAAGERPPYVLVGHSFGGLVMRVFARAYAAETAALVLVDPAHPEDWVHPAPKEQALIDRGVHLCRQGSRVARTGLAHVISGLVGLGALTPARFLMRAVTRHGLETREEHILAPMWKLPAEARRPLRHFWTRAKFFDALGSQIESMPVSARQVLDAAAGGYDDLPLVTISSTNPGDHRWRQQEALAALSRRGRHVMAANSGHWVPLDEPSIVVDAIREVCELVGTGRGRG